MENLNKNLEILKMAQEKAIKEYLHDNPDKTILDIYQPNGQWEDEIEYSFIEDVNKLINKHFIALWEELKN